ncbi:BQ5605_C036g11517 [Microbotryum silenes-dioicae]|uniref:BQ5605_C036g11517 protein n=1 Tax=Microbotryum silenes-dioicae TaxID=796604 RepID=A0A2X0N250_9BASI|nr:BQ5605_C036g11517 [Microbotryum silenes-dioicae]
MLRQSVDLLHHQLQPTDIQKLGSQSSHPIVIPPTIPVLGFHRLRYLFNNSYTTNVVLRLAATRTTIPLVLLRLEPLSFRYDSREWSGESKSSEVRPIRKQQKKKRGPCRPGWRWLEDRVQLEA